MSLRRLVLFMGLVVMVFTAARRVDAADVDVEGSAHAGTGSGAWACGPKVSAKYGGVGGEIRVHTDLMSAPAAAEDSPQKTEESAPAAQSEAAVPTTTTKTAAEPDDELRVPSGLLLAGGGLVEYREYKRIDDGTSGTSGLVVPSSGPVGAGGARVGYDWTAFGFHLGAIGLQRYDNADDRRATLLVWPDVALRFGKLDFVRAEIGVGSYAVPTLIHPGLYIGLGFSPAPGWDVVWHLGAHATVAEYGYWRGDLAVRVPIARHLQIGAGVAIASGERPAPEPEGRLLFVAKF